MSPEMRSLVSAVDAVQEIEARMTAAGDVHGLRVMRGMSAAELDVMVRLERGIQ